MGSLEKAILTGYICRLCSEMHRLVYHIYGDECLRLCVADKINRYLSINVSPSDPLPKTICTHCMERLENQHKLMLIMERTSNFLKSRTLSTTE